MFNGIRFFLSGFDPASEAQFRSELVNCGGVDVGRFDSSCTHVIVRGLTHDDPVCVAARSDDKTLVTNLWVEDSLDIGSLADSSRILYKPLKDLKGISGAESLVICLTGYQRKERDDIMKMVTLIGAQFSKPLMASKVTHLICYKSEGEKYELAKKTGIKLVNHQWLEDCLKAWEILPVDKYNKSSWELEIMEAEARDSEEETELHRSRLFISGSRMLITQCSELPTPAREVPKTPQNAATAKRSLQIGEDILMNNKLLSTPGEGTNSYSAPDISEAKTKVQEGSGYQGLGAHPQTGTDGVIMDGSIGRVVHMPNERSPDLNKEARKPCTVAGTSKRSADPDVFSGKFYKLCFSRKISRKSTSSMLADLSGHLFSSPQVHLENNIKDVSRNSLLSLDQFEKNFRSGEIQTPIAQSEMHCAEGQMETLPQKSKKAVLESHIRCPYAGDQNTATENLSTTTRSSELDSSSMKTDIPQAKINPSCDNNKNPLVGLVSPDSASNRHTKKVKRKSSSHGKKPLKCNQLFLKTMASDNASSPAEGKVMDLPCDIEPGHVFKKSMGVSDTMMMVTGSKSGVEVEANKYLESMAIDSGKMIDTFSKENKTPETSSNDLKGSKLDEKPDSLEMSIERSLSHQDGELRVAQTLHNSNTTSTRRRKCETHKLPSPDSGDMHKDGSAKAPSVTPRKLITKKDTSRMTKLGTGKPSKGKGPTFSDKIDTPSNVTICSENNRDGSELEEAGVTGKSEIAGLTSKADVIMEEKLKRSWGHLRKNKSKTGAVDETVPMDAEKENKLTASRDQSGNLDRQLNKKATVKSNRMSPQCKEWVDGSNAAGLEAGRCSTAASSVPVWFILSGHRLQRKEFKKVIRQLRGRVCRDSHQWSYQATHFILSEPIRRTEKFFAAAAAGRWILKMDYLTASSQAGKFLAEEPFEWHKNGLSEDGSINLEAPRKWRLLKERTGHGTLYGLHIVIYGECIAPSLDTMKRVMKAGDGTILATSPPYDRALKCGVDYAVISPGMPLVDCWVQEFLKHKIPCILADYLVEFVCKPGYSLDRHVLYNTHAWAEKSFANMSSSLQEIIEAGMRQEGDNDTVC